MLHQKTMKIAGFLLAGVLMSILIYQLPPVKQRLSWRLDMAAAYLRGISNPAGKLPTALPQPRVATTARPNPTAAQPKADADLPGITQPIVSLPAPTPTATPIPGSISLLAPAWEKQDINNCGPATLSLYLRFYGWEGDQFTISELLKPQRDDRNVNVEELIYYLRTSAGWLNAIYRVGGHIETLKKFLAAGIPVMIEESFAFEDPFWPNDDLWAAHYNLLTGFDDASQTFTSQDTFYGANRAVSYAKLDEDWRAFNRVYILAYPPAMEETIKAILGENWDPDINRQNALEKANEEAQNSHKDAFAFFNIGTNLVYFEQYNDAAEAFDQARELGLPQRMLRYQFTPFFAYFYTRRIDDLLALTEYALKITPNSEEALLWQGWGLYRKGDKIGAVESFRQALVENPNYTDAQYAIDFVQANP